MSILITGMEMPKPGHIVLVEIDENGDMFAAYDGGRTKLTQHKAIPVPPHGDLVERKAVLNTFSTHMNRTMHYVTIRDTVPTIIPASEEGEL